MCSHSPYNQTHLMFEVSYVPSTSLRSSYAKAKCALCAYVVKHTRTNSRLIQTSKLYVMIRHITPILITIFLTSCSSDKPETKKEGTTVKDTVQTASPIDTTPKVVGIGGIFYYSDAPKET